MLSTEYWENVFETEDPWGYSESQYEAWKFDLTLSVLGDEKPKRALEIACAEGHLTMRIAPRVGFLTAIDISPTAVARARKRCQAFDNVEIQVLNLIDGKLPGKQNLIVCSEMLFYLPLNAFREAAHKIAAALAPGGQLLLAHGNLISDDRTTTGFDWGHPFGAKTIGSEFAAIGSLYLERQLRTALFTIQLFRRERKAGETRPKPRLEEAPIPFDLELSRDVERTIIWNGAAITRSEAMEKELASEVPILMYHSIADQGPPELKPYRVSPRAFREQLRYLRSQGFHSITLSDWAEAVRNRAPIQGRPIIITFDDGYQDFADNAWPELQRSDFSATMFVVTDKVGLTADWDSHSGEPMKLMTWETLAKLRENGVEIASHSASHKDFSNISREQARAEGGRSREAILDRLGVDTDCIAFPWGRTSDSAVDALEECGYRVAVTTWGGRAALGSKLMSLPRIEILGDDDITIFARRLAGHGPETDASPARRQTGLEVAPKEDLQPQVVQRGERAVALDSSMPLQPEYANTIASRLDALVGEFVKLQTQLLRELNAPLRLQKRLAGMFCQAVTGATRRRLHSGQEISQGVRVRFDEGTAIELTVDPKPDHTHSPETYLNTLKLHITGSSGWSWFEIDLEWGELTSAERFQFSIFAQANRRVGLQAGLRYPRRGLDPVEQIFTTLELSPDDRNAIASGELSVPDLVEFDTSARPQLLLFFETESELTITIHYLNVYFA